MATKTKAESPKTDTAQDLPPVQDNLPPARIPMDPRIAKAYSLEAAQWRVLVGQIFPSAKSLEAVLMALEYCRVRELDIYKRPVHIVPMWDSMHRRWVETVWPGISEIRVTAHRTRQYAGADEVEYGPTETRTFSGTTKDGKPQSLEVTYPQWAKMTVYRLIDHHRVSYTAQVFWLETYATLGKFSEVPNSMWAKRPFGQLAKCVEAAVLRMAFPEASHGDLTAEEMQGQVIEHVEGEVAPTPQQTAISDGPPDPPPALGKAVENVVEDLRAAVDEEEVTEETTDDEPEDWPAKAQQWFFQEKVTDVGDLEFARSNFINLYGDDLSKADLAAVEKHYKARLAELKEAEGVTE